MEAHSYATDQARRASEWWDMVCDPDSGSTATRAQLRRARSPAETLVIPQAVLLARMLGVVNATDGRFSDALDLARVLAHVRTNAASHPMRTLGWPSFPGDRREAGAAERPPLTELRFRRLMATTVGEERVSAFVRLIRLLNGSANVAAVADAFLRWNHPSERVKKEWAFAYFNAGSAPPEDHGTFNDEDDA